MSVWLLQCGHHLLHDMHARCDTTTPAEGRMFLTQTAGASPHAMSKAPAPYSGYASGDDASALSGATLAHLAQRPAKRQRPTPAAFKVRPHSAGG